MGQREVIRFFDGGREKSGPALGWIANLKTLEILLLLHKFKQDLERFHILSSIYLEDFNNFIWVVIQMIRKLDLSVFGRINQGFYKCFTNLSLYRKDLIAI